MANSYCNPASVVQGDKYRFSILTPYMMRMEYSENGVFTDEPTQTVLNRDFPVPDYTVCESGDKLEIDTKAFHMVYDKKKFSEGGLFIDVKYDFTNYGGRWYYGTTTYSFPPREHNLKGTMRTLDRADGEVELEYGLMDKSGRTFFDDSDSFLFDKDGTPVVRKNKEIDVYYLAYGRDYFKCLRDFYKLSGAIPMLPRYALGNWWSRYWKYDEESYRKLLNEFERRNIPFSVAVMDMDWHIVDVPMESGGGWTGYTWNNKLFPDPDRFLSWLHNHGYRVTLNVHPASGIRSFEKMYKEVAQFMGVNPESGKTIEFDMTNKEFIEAYFKFVHHPHEKSGVDFWWLDWQQGAHCGVSGVNLDPLWLLNYYHFKDMEKQGKRGLILSRYSGLGSHRYPIGFSGDTIVTWKSLAFQPYFTATASNVGYTWWSHDIGGHMSGYKDNELALRWYQFGVFSPINRLHSSSNPFCGKEPWNYPEPYCSDMEAALRFRHGLIPYMYTLNYRCHNELVPVIIPTYYYYPFEEKAYNSRNQYFLGSELLVCPVTTPVNHASQRSSEKYFISAGMWTDIFTGDVYNGGDKGKNAILCRNLHSIPVLGKPGAIIPMASELNYAGNSGNTADYDVSSEVPEYDYITNKDNTVQHYDPSEMLENEHVRKGRCNDISNPPIIDVIICPGASNTFVMYEDTGDGFGYEQGEYAMTEFAMEWHDSYAVVSVNVSGDTSVIPDNRSYRFIFRGFNDNIDFVSENADGSSNVVNNYYDKKTNTWTVVIGSSGECKSTYNNLQLKLASAKEKGALTYDGSRIKDRIYDFLLYAQMSNNDKKTIYNMFTQGADMNVILSDLMAMRLDGGVVDALMEYIVV